MYCMVYSFRNRIRLGYKKLQSDLKTCRLDKSESGEIVTLVALATPSGESFRTANWLFLDGRGYQSSDQAFEAGKLWRQYLSVSFARAGIAADFDARPIQPRQANERPESPEAPGLVVYRSGLRFDGWASGIRIEPTLELFLSDYLPVVRDSIPDGFNPLPDDLKMRLELAYRLVHLALLNISSDVEYILWMTAVEALIPDEKPHRHSDEAIGVLQSLRDQVANSGMRRKLRKRVDWILERAQQETKTIVELGIELARKLPNDYDGLPPGEFFAKYYDGRSCLVHGSIDEEERPDPREIDRRLPHLQKFVMDLLAVEASSVE